MVDFEAERWRLKMENSRKMALSETAIETYCEQTGYDLVDVRRKIRNDEMFRWFFVVDPIRQNVHEKTAIRHIDAIHGVTGFRKYGTNEMFIVNGGIVAKNDLRGMRPSCKSLDFTWQYGGRTFYAYHKYTKTGGGHQDNQYKDLQDFINAANQSQDRDVVFVAIADGGYYDTLNGHAGVSKLRRLDDMTNHSTTFVAQIDTLEDLLRSNFAGALPHGV